MDWAETPLDANSDWSYYGVPEPEIIVVGHSHVACMLDSMKAGNGSGDRPSGVVYRSSSKGRAVPDNEYWERVADRAAGIPLAIVWQGNQHAEFVIEAGVPVSLASAPDIDEAAQAIPEEMFRELWRPTMDGLVAQLTRMRPVSRLFVLGTPAPKSSEACLVGLWNERYFTNAVTIMNIPAARVRIVRAAVRQRLWSIIQGLTQETAEAHGAIFVPSPPQSRGADGLLRAEFCETDVTHSNPAYGAIMWAELNAVLDQHPVSA